MAIRDCFRTRRDVLRLAGAATLAGVMADGAVADARGEVVVVGGGFGGAACARYLRRLAPGINVTLVERNARFVTCPFSNLVIGGLQDLASVTHSYANLAGDGIVTIQAEVTAIDAERKLVHLRGRESIPYDRLVVAPGIDFKWGRITGYDEVATQRMPHAWKAGPQTALLCSQLSAMDDGGLVVMAIPDNPFRCPPGPYERASLIANYLKAKKPKSKLLLLDSKDSFSKQALFRAAWERLYPGIIEWVGFSEGGNVVEVVPTAMVVRTDFEEFRPDVANIIPPQRAARLVDTADLAGEGDWCEVDQGSFESVRIPGIHIIGDAVVAGAMPKSGFSANSQAKVCAAAIVSSLRDRTMPEPVYFNTCYSFLSQERAISVSAVYRLNDENEIAPVPGSGGTSPMDADLEFRQAEAEYAMGWYASITSEMFG